MSQNKTVTSPKAGMQINDTVQLHNAVAESYHACCSVSANVAIMGVAVVGTKSSSEIVGRTPLRDRGAFRLTNAQVSGATGPGCWKLFSTLAPGGRRFTREDLPRTATTHVAERAECFGFHVMISSMARLLRVSDASVLKASQVIFSCCWVTS